MDTPPDTLLVDPLDLAAFDKASQVSAVADDGFARDCIAAAQGLLATVLGYEPFAHLEQMQYGPTLFVGGLSICYAEARPVWATFTPGVSVLTDGRLAVPGGFGTAVYGAGWRRADQDAVALRVLPGLEALTADEASAVPPVPADLRTGLMMAALAVANPVRSTQLGTAQTSNDYGNGVSTRTVADLEAARDILTPYAARYAVVRV